MGKIRQETILGLGIAGGEITLVRLLRQADCWQVVAAAACVADSPAGAAARLISGLGGLCALPTYRRRHRRWGRDVRRGLRARGGGEKRQGDDGRPGRGAISAELFDLGLAGDGRIYRPNMQRAILVPPGRVGR